MADAVDLCHELAETVSLLEAGAISVGHVRAILECTRDIGTHVRAAVQDRVLPKAARQTVSEFRQSVRRAVGGVRSSV